MTAFSFVKAVKSQERLRLALDGPAGGGKTWTALTVGTYLAAKEGGRVALIDSERSSAKKYAHDFDFDHLTLPDFSPHTYIAAIRAASDAGYTVLIVDSLSHAWEGTLELKDQVAARSRSHDSFGAWREVTPVHNELVDLLLRLPAHVIATMRTGTEYLVDPTNPDKSKRVQKVGTKPVQRAGVDYEFDVVGDFDQENTLVITKSRCRVLSGAVIRKPDDRFASTLYEWLNDGEPLATREDIDALRASVKAIADVQQRNEVARQFKDEFGPLEELPASKVTSAREFVAAREGGIGGSPEGKGAEPPAASERDQPARVLVTQPAPALSPEDDDRHRKRVNAVMSEAGIKGDDERHALIAHATGGAAESSRGLTAEQVAAVVVTAGQVKAGELVALHALDGSVTFATPEPAAS